LIIAIVNATTGCSPQSAVNTLAGKLIKCAVHVLI
jgi:CRISPR/Cas system-associated protein Csm6